VSRDSVVKLTQKVDQLRFEYLEKDRELTVLKNEITLREDSFNHQLLLVQSSLDELRAQNTLLQKENEALRSQQQASTITEEVTNNVAPPQDLIMQERVQRAEMEAEQMRERARELTVEAERLRVAENQAEFARIKAEEEAKGLREQLVQKNFQIRLLEEVNQDNKELQ
jgi:hypothetical protein